MPQPSAETEQRSARRADLGIALLLLLLAALAVGPGLLPGRTVVPLDILGLFEPWRDRIGPPANPLLSDPALQFSSRAFIAASLKAGQFPLWNPTVLAGFPLAGDTQIQLYNPLHLLPAALLPAHRAFALQLLLQLWLAGLFMVAWMRQLVGSRFAALVAAIVWMLAAYQQVWLAYPAFMGSLMWLPAVAAAWEHAIRGRARRFVALGGLAGGMVIVGGQLQFAFFGALVLLAYGLVRVIGMPVADGRRAARLGAAIAVLGLGLGALHALPALELARDTVRLPFSRDVIGQTGVPLSQLPTLVAPWILGDPRRGDFHGAQNYNEMALYIGLIPLLLALATPWARRDRLTASLAAIALGVALIALGTPLAWPLAAIPIVNLSGLMRWLAMGPLVAAPLLALGLAGARKDPALGRRLRHAALALATILALALGLIVARGLDDIEPRDWLPPLLGLGVAAALLWLWTLRPRSPWRSGLLAAAVALDLLGFGLGYTPSSPLADAYPVLPPVDRVAAERQAEPFRIAVFHTWPLVLGPAVAPNLGLDEIGGYSPSNRASYQAFVRRLSQPSPDLAANLNIVALGDADPLLLRLLNVRYVLSAEPLPDVVRAVAAATDDCSARHALQPGQRVGRVITPRAGGLNRIDLRGIRGGTLALHLARDSDTSQHLAYAELGGELGATRTLYFEPIADSAEGSFFVYVDLPAGATGPPPEVCVDAEGLALDAWTTLPRYPRAFEDDRLVVSRVPDPLGRAWIVPEARLVADQATALAALAGPAFDPRREVIVESEAGIVTDAVGPARTAGNLSVRDEGPNRRRVLIEGGAGGWLVLSEAFAPGWTARVGGRDLPVLRANGGLQALPLPPGSREIELVFRPASLRLGAAITLSSLVLALALLTGNRKASFDPNPRR